MSSKIQDNWLLVSGFARSLFQPASRNMSLPAQRHTFNATAARISWLALRVLTVLWCRILGSAWESNVSPSKSLKKNPNNTSKKKEMNLGNSKDPSKTTFLKKKRMMISSKQLTLQFYLVLPKVRTVTDYDSTFNHL